MEGVLQLKRELHDVLLEEAQHGLELYGDISVICFSIEIIVFNRNVNNHFQSTSSSHFYVHVNEKKLNQGGGITCKGICCASYQPSSFVLQVCNQTVQLVWSHKSTQQNKIILSIQRN